MRPHLLLLLKSQYNSIFPCQNYIILILAVDLRHNLEGGGYTRTHHFTYIDYILQGVQKRSSIDIVCLLYAFLKHHTINVKMIFLHVIPKKDNKF